VFADEVHRARYVAKVHTTRPAGFASPMWGPTGLLTEGVPYFTAPPAPRLAAMHPLRDEPPEVALVPAVLGDTGTHLRAVAGAGVDGIVVAVMGAGHMPERLLPALELAVDRMPVAASSRTGAGRLLRQTYDFPGSERDLHRLGLLDGCDLNPLKARVLLTVALWSHEDRDDAEAAFRQHAAAP
jgi:L-asparaginase